jgi:hypothetical protein
MRCRNCHTVLMEADAECPVCHASMASATAAAPAPSESSSGMLKLLPIFGGAAGGLLYAALANSDERATSRSARRPRESSPLKWIFGLLLILGGGLFLILAFVHFCETWRIARREPTAVTGADLRRLENAKSAAPWIAYTFAESKPTELILKRSRLGHGGDVQARCLLVRVEDKWLVASVAPGFEGNNLVGRLMPIDSPLSQSLIERVRKLELNPSSLLPYEFNAVDGSSSDQRIRYIAVACIALFGLLGLLFGVYLFRTGRPHPAVRRPRSYRRQWTG